MTRHDFQSTLAQQHGATTFAYEPREQLIGEIAEWTGAHLLKPWLGLPMLHPGGVDVLYDTVATAESLEVGIRVLKARGRMAITGVSQPGRFERSPWTQGFELHGSNAFGMEDVDGVREYAIAHYLDLAGSGRVDVRDARRHVPLDRWRDAFGALARQGATRGAEGRVRLPVRPAVSPNGPIRSPRDRYGH